MDENPYEAPRTRTASLEPAENEPSRSVPFGLLILGTIAGACVGGVLAAVLLSFTPNSPEAALGRYAHIPVTCVTTLACIGAFFGWCHGLFRTKP